MDLVWSVVVCAAAGALGGFLARVVPGGRGKTDVKEAPAEAGAVVSTLAGAVAGTLVVLMSDQFNALVIIGSGKDLSKVTLGVGDVVTAFSTGLIGLKWLVNHQDSQTLRKAVAEAASAPQRLDAARAASASKPRDVLLAAQGK